MPIQIDIRSIVRQKAPKVNVPDFAIRYLERITHVKQMNAFLTLHSKERNYDFIKLVLEEELGCSASIKGIENIPTDDRPVIFVSNHPLGGLDGMIIAQMIHESRNNHSQVHTRPLKVIVNDLLMYMEPLSDLWAPVSKSGKLSREQVLIQQQLWESDNDILSFPAGSCSRLQKCGNKWQVKDLEWQKNFILKAKEYKRDIIPIYFEGKNSMFFYLLSLIRKTIGIKSNIEMLYLVDEMYKARGKHFNVYVLPPISHTTFDCSRSPIQWAQYIKSIVYARNHTSC